MKIIEIGTGYTSIPANKGAATEVVVEELTKAFLKLGIETKIIDIEDKNRMQTNLDILEVKFPRFLASTDVELGIIHKLKRVLYSIALAKYLKEMINNSDKELVLHFHNQYNLYFFIKLTPKLLREKVKIVYTVHSYIWSTEWSKIRNIVKIKYFQEVYSMKHADHVFVLNENTRNNIIKHVCITPSKVHLIDNGVNTYTYKPISAEEERLFRKDKKLVEKKVFIQVGSVCERKNQLGSLKLLKPYLLKNRDFVFLYAGGIISNEYYALLKKYAEDNNIAEQVQYLGELKPGKELNHYYNVAEAMIFPSKSEGFSLVILEAMSAGTPVFINNTLQFKLSEECLTFKNCQDFGMLIEKWILDEKAKKQLSNKIREAIIKNYSWDIVANNYIKIITKS